MAVRRVLIVEDQAEVRRMLRAAVESLPVAVEVHDAPSGEEALMMIATRPFDLLISDLRLPGMSGLELQPRALAANPALKLILITGVTDARLRQQAADAGAYAFFTKPVDLPAFLDTVQSCLGENFNFSEKMKFLPVEEEIFNFSEKLKILPPEAPPALPPIDGALAAGLLDAQGRWLAESVAWPAEMRPALAEAVLAAARLEALSGAPALPPALPLSLLIPGQAAGLLVLGWDAGLFLAALFPAHVDLEEKARLLRQAASASDALLDPPEDAGPVDERLALLLDPASAPSAPAPGAPADADDFWEQLAGQQPEITHPEGEQMLSYEQARRLGLAPGVDSDGG